MLYEVITGGLELAEDAVDHGLHLLVPGDVGGEHAGERPDLEDFAFVAGRFDPAVGAGLVAVGDGLAVVGVQGAGA